MHYFNVIDGCLYCEEVKVADVCESVGTPFYLYSKRTFCEHYQKLDAAFADMKRLICYSVKSCSNVAILKTLAKLGCGADIVSGGELYRALTAGIDPKKIVYSGVGKTDQELAEAIEAGILMFNVESPQESEAINEIAGRMGKTAGIALRVNPDVDAHTHEKITTGKAENKFGIPLTDALAEYKKAARLPNVKILGVDCHIGSQILTPEPYVESIAALRALIFQLADEEIKLQYLNIGGGLGIIYQDEQPSTAANFRKEIDHLVKDLPVTLVMEPGRFISGNAGALITKVLFVKQTRSKKFVIVDSGMNDLIRPTLYGAYHAITPIAPKAGETQIADVVGPVCESGDFFAKDRPMPDLYRGDCVAVMSAGAYGAAMSSNYNSRPKCAEVLVEGASFKIIRRRQTYADMAGEEIF